MVADIKRIHQNTYNTLGETQHCAVSYHEYNAEYTAASATNKSAFEKSKRVKEFKEFIVAVCQRAILGFGQLC